MLDAAKLAKRIREAMDGMEPPLTGRALAVACGVTDQAVSAWRKTGRIHKKHLQKLAELTGKSLDFFLSANGTKETGESPIDDSGFRKLQRAWQEATPGNRENLLALATAILKLDGGKKRRTG
jgi:transcriptional regulator with XRE-family HTH domain